MMPNGQQPIFIMPEGTDRTRGKTAQGNNIAAAKAVADAVKSTLGPKGMDKMLVNGLGDVLITNDGATILREINVEHPAAKMVIEVSKTQEAQCFDGTTSAVVLAGALLKESEALIEKNVHPTVIASGYRLASSKALETLEKCVLDERQLSKVGKDLGAIAKVCAETALTGKFTDTHEGVKDVMSGIAGDAVNRLSDGINPPNLDDINVICATGGSVEDSYLMDGIVLEKEKAHNGMPTAVDGASLALVDFAIEVKKTEVDARIQITSPDQMQDFLDQEETALRNMVKKFQDAGANVVLCQKKIDDLALHYMAKAGIMALQSCRKSELSSVAKATGAVVISDLDDLVDADLGSAGHVIEERIGENLMVRIGGVSEVDSRAVTVILRGATTHVVEEIERAFDDALGVVSLVINTSQIVVGGGCTFAAMAKNLREYASTVAGRKQMAIEAYAKALEEIPSTIAENAGMDPVDSIIALRAAHANSAYTHGILVTDEETDLLVDNLLHYGVVEPLSVVKQALISATETSTMILRIDDVIQMRQAGPQGSPMM
jgi:thermosome